MSRLVKPSDEAVWYTDLIRTENIAIKEHGALLKREMFTATT